PNVVSASSGLAVVKELLELGHEVTSFEKKSTVGGVYRKSYDFLKLTTSSLNIAYGSMMPDNVCKPVIWSGSEYIAYLQDYALKFDLHRHIYFTTEVVSLEKRNATWELNASSVKPRNHPNISNHIIESTLALSHLSLPAEGKTFEFDHIAVCSGQSGVPKLPVLYWTR
ncbi:MAG: hypothetical protein AAF669_06525, partial [Pseudomonadota bacterium]